MKKAMLIQQAIAEKNAADEKFANTVEQYEEHEHINEIHSVKVDGGGVSIHDKEERFEIEMDFNEARRLAFILNQWGLEPMSAKEYNEIRAIQSQESKCPEGMEFGADFDDEEECAECSLRGACNSKYQSRTRKKGQKKSRSSQ